MKRKFIPLSIFAILTMVSGCTNESTTSDVTSQTTDSSSVTSTTDSTNTSTNTDTSIEGDFDSLATCNNASIGTAVNVAATMTGSDGAGYFLQDKTGSFYAYYGDNAPAKNYGNIYTIKGEISEYAENKQIASGSTIVDTNKKGNINIIEVNNFNELKNNKYAPVKLRVKLTSEVSYTSGKDCRINVEFDGQTMLVFFKRFISSGATIANKIKEAGLNNYFTINGGFSNAYNGTPQISLTDPSQIEVTTISSDEDKIAYAEGLVSHITSLNGKSINSSLTLPTSGNYGVTFSYESSDESYLSKTGKITRPTDNNVNVALKINIYLNGSLKKTISVSLTILASSSSGDVQLTEEAKKYYSSIDFSLTGKELKSDLASLITTHTVISYSNLASVYADSDTYVDSKDGKTYLVDIYSNQKYTLSDNGSSANAEGQGWNKEHTIPQSWFGKASPMVSDAFHIYPTDIRVNSMRGSFMYGEVASANFTSSNGAKRGTSALSGVSGTVFEVGDEYKGDIARTYFYMVTAYEDKAGNWGNHFSNANYSKLTSYSLSLFMKWAKEDPVSEREILRNEGIYKHQKNRNPFIDVPSLADTIFGDLL